MDALSSMIGQSFSLVGSVVPFFILLGVVVTVHEFGHYAAGRAFGAAVESFAFGFGNSIFERTDKRGTRWRLNWLPLGGFVKFVGEAQAPGDVGKVEQGPIGKPFPELLAWQRVIVSLAGPVTNFILAILIIACLAMANGKNIVDRVQVAEIEKNGPADQAGFRVGDYLLEANSRKIISSRDVLVEVAYNADSEVTFLVERDGKPVELTVIPERVIEQNSLTGEEEIGRIKIKMAAPIIGHEPIGLVEGLAYGADMTADIVRQTITVLGRLITLKDDFGKMRGPLGMGDFADKVVDSHLKKTDVALLTRIQSVVQEMAWLIALFSVSIGFFNLLPIPMLDGYSALLGLYETVVGSEISGRVQGYLLQGGLAAIGLFFIAVTVNDLKRLGVFDVFTSLLS